MGSLAKTILPSSVITGNSGKFETSELARTSFFVIALVIVVAGVTACSLVSSTSTSGALKSVAFSSSISIVIKVLIKPFTLPEPLNRLSASPLFTYLKVNL